MTDSLHGVGGIVLRMKSDSTKIASRTNNTKRFARNLRIAEIYCRRIIDPTATTKEVNSWLGSTKEMKISAGIYTLHMLFSALPFAIKKIMKNTITQ